MPRDALDLLGDPTDVPVGRRFVGERLSRWGMSDLRDEVQLTATELLSNGLLHVGPPLRLLVEASDGVVRIEVHDTSMVPPVRPSSPSAGLTGRGLALVDALAARWGVLRTESGKAVWAEITAESAAREPHPATDPVTDSADDVDALLAAFDDEADWPDAAAPAGSGASAEAEPRYTVVIGDVPTDLLLAAKAHIDGLVREFSLVSSGGVAGVSAPPPPPLAALIEVVTSEFAEARAGIKRQAATAAARGEPRTTLRLTLPVSAADAGERYLAALDAADTYARSARLLTLEEPPQHSAFRHWYVTSLAAALRAAAGGPAAVHRTFEEFLLGEVDRLSGLRRSAERSARLQRVSETLTGATTAEEVGRAVLAEAVEALGAVRGALLVPDPPSLVEMASLRSMRLAACHGAPPKKSSPKAHGTTPEVSPAVAAMVRGEPIWIETATERDAHFPVLGAEQPDIVALCAVPLMIGAKRVGALRLTFSEPRLFDSDERSFLSALASTTATSLDRARLFDAQRTLADRLARLQDISAALVAARTRDEVAEIMVSQAADVLGATVGTLCLLTDDGTELEMARAGGIVLDDTWRRFPVAAPLPASEAIRTNAPVVVADLDERDRRYPDLVGIQPREDHALICLPLSVGDRRLGAVTLSFPASRSLDAEEIGFLRSLATECAQALDRANALADAQAAGEKLAFVATTLQRSLLPTSLPQVAGLELAWHYRPGTAGTQVGGDWFDVIPLPRGRVALVIGDVMGRGIRAAAVMGQLRTATRAYAALDLPPERVLALLDGLVQALDVPQIVTAIYAVYDPGSRALTIANAGHVPPIVLPPGARLPAPGRGPGPTGIPLGVGGVAFTAQTVSLAPGTVLALYTDGLVETRERDVVDGIAVLTRVLARSGPDLDGLADATVDALTPTGGSDDDVALLLARTSLVPVPTPAAPTPAAVPATRTRNEA